jgi:small subunit ribosomal protein S4
MARYIGPKNRLARREGQDLGLKTPGTTAHASLLRRLNILPGIHGQKRRRKPSEFASQLREKQKAKRIYGVLERQFRRYFGNALKKKGATGEALLQALETRLDNVIYRLSFTPTRAAARQLVSHGHVQVDGKKVNIPSYNVAKDEVIALLPKAMKIPAIAKMLEDKNPHLPSWLERKGPVGKVLKIPSREEIETDLNEQLIVEYFSR